MKLQILFRSKKKVLSDLPQENVQQLFNVNCKSIPCEASNIPQTLISHSQTEITEKFVLTSGVVGSKLVLSRFKKLSIKRTFSKTNHIVRAKFK